jgi:cytoskeletal protein CcmA (bactofilin family)
MKEKDRRREYDEQKITGFFDKDTEFKGELSFKGSFRIDGSFKGTIVSDSMLVVGEQGKVEADVRAGYVVINGEIKGAIRAEDKVEIHSRGRVVGSITTAKLVVEEGAYLEANCMVGEQVEVGKPVAETPKKEETQT